MSASESSDVLLEAADSDEVLEAPEQGCARRAKRRRREQPESDPGAFRGEGRMVAILCKVPPGDEGSGSGSHVALPHPGRAGVFLLGIVSLSWDLVTLEVAPGLGAGWRRHAETVHEQAQLSTRLRATKVGELQYYAGEHVHCDPPLAIRVDLGRADARSALREVVAAEDTLQRFLDAHEALIWDFLLRPWQLAVEIVLGCLPLAVWMPVIVRQGRASLGLLRHRPTRRQLRYFRRAVAGSLKDEPEPSSEEERNAELCAMRGRND